MKPKPSLAGTLRSRCRRPRAAGFTLTEFLVSSAILIITLGALVGSHIFGLRLLEFTETATETSVQDRRLAAQLDAEISAAKLWKVGSGKTASFTETGVDRPQVGDTLQIHATTNTAQYVRYYLDRTAGTLSRITSAQTMPVVVAEQIINNNVFSAEDWAGNVLTNRQQFAALGVSLQFRDDSLATTSRYKKRPGRQLNLKLWSRMGD